MRGSRLRCSVPPSTWEQKDRCRKGLRRLRVASTSREGDRGMPNSGTKRRGRERERKRPRLCGGSGSALEGEKRQEKILASRV